MTLRQGQAQPAASQGLLYVAEARVYDWRCSNAACLVRPRMGLYAETGGLYIRVSARRGSAAHYIFNLQQGSAIAHCDVCHTWRELYYDRARGQVADREYTGPRPAIDCRCPTPSAARSAGDSDAGPGSAVH